MKYPITTPVVINSLHYRENRAGGTKRANNVEAFLKGFSWMFLQTLVGKQAKGALYLLTRPYFIFFNQCILA
jgi:hypothetical protein